MKFSSIISNPALPLVIDTSVVVNLHACTYGKQILTAVPNKILVAQIAAEELKSGSYERAFLDDMVNSNLVQLTALTDLEYELFQKLTMSLDDGESATIALAITRRLFPFIDERKGRSQAIALQTKLEPGWSLDLISHPEVMVQLGKPADSDVVYLALKEGRMRIPEERANEVIQLVGIHRAIECVCLPNYKKRFPKPTV